MKAAFEDVLMRAADGIELSKEELIVLINAEGRECDALFQLADQVCRRYLGEEVYLRGIIEFSNYCRNNCLFCGLRRSNRNLPRYRMSSGEVIESARKAVALGCNTIVLQSGEDEYYTADALAELVYQIKKKMDVAVTLSVGDRPREAYKTMREAGADRYLLKHETCDPVLFTRLKPGASLAGRVAELRWLGELGFQVGSGNMVGLPGQTVETLAGDIVLMRKLKVQMAGIGPFIPNRQTPLGSCPGGTLELTLKTLAAARLALPLVHLPATTAVRTIDPFGRERALKGGANVIMPNMTPPAYRTNYLLYPGKTGLADTPEESFAAAVKAVADAGRKVAKKPGFAQQGRPG
jgi:biotin synthase